MFKPVFQQKILKLKEKKHPFAQKKCCPKKIKLYPKCCSILFPKQNICVQQKQYLVGGWTNPFEKYARQIGSSPQVGVKIKNIWNHDVVLYEHNMGISSHLLVP